MQKVNWLNDLKLSVGYGITGNQTGLDPYKTLELYGTDGVYYDTGSWLPSYKISQNANPDLKWEQTAMLNIGLDFSVLDSRLGGRIEWYNKRPLTCFIPIRYQPLLIYIIRSWQT